jgi:hypothetical protein
MPCSPWINTTHLVQAADKRRPFPVEAGMPSYTDDGQAGQHSPRVRHQEGEHKCRKVAGRDLEADMYH